MSGLPHIRELRTFMRPSDGRIDTLARKMWGSGGSLNADRVDADEHLAPGFRVGEQVHQKPRPSDEESATEAAECARVSALRPSVVSCDAANPRRAAVAARHSIALLFRGCPLQGRDHERRSTRLCCFAAVAETDHEDGTRRPPQALL